MSHSNVLLQFCIFGVCIPLDVVIPGILAWLYYIGIDLLWFLPASWRNSAHAPAVVEGGMQEDSTNNSSAEIKQEEEAKVSAEAAGGVIAGRAQTGRARRGT
jgi:hypothetical protein